MKLNLRWLTVGALLGLLTAIATFEAFWLYKSSLGGAIFLFSCAILLTPALIAAAIIFNTDTKAGA